MLGRNFFNHYAETEETTLTTGESEVGYGYKRNTAPTADIELLKNEIQHIKQQHADKQQENYMLMELVFSQKKH